MYTASKNYAFQALIVQDGTKLRLLRKENVDRLEKKPFVFAFRRGDFAQRRKVFCAKAQGVLRIGKSVLSSTFLPFSLALAPTKPRPLTPSPAEEDDDSVIPKAR